MINSKTKEVLESYSWPQNTREIQDLVENWVVSGERLITPEQIPTHIKNNINPYESVISDYYLDLVEEMGLKDFLTVFKKELITAMIKRYNGVPLRASKVMKGSYPSLMEFMKKNSDKSFNTRSLQ